MHTYSNFDELQDDNPSAANELLEQVGEGLWQNDFIVVYDSYWEIGEFELYEGWMHDSLNLKAGDIDIRRFVDCDRLGECLVSLSDRYVLVDDDIIELVYGW